MEKTRLLIVDDHANFLDSLLDLFQEIGYCCDHAANGFQAIEKIKQKCYPVILMDIKMPGLNGVDTFEEIIKIQPKANVILMTAYKVDKLVDQAILKGVKAIVKKPLNLEQVVDLIQQCSV